MEHTASAFEQSRPVTTRTVTGIADPALRHKSGVISLLSAREDLRGVHAFADVVEEAVRWSA